MLALLVALLSPPPFHGYQPAKIGVAKGKITVTVAHDGKSAIPDKPIGLTVEPYSLMVKTTVGLNEKRLLGTAFSADLDGDGKTESTIHVACDGTSAKFTHERAGARVELGRTEPVIQGATWVYREANFVRIPQSKAWLMQYSPCENDEVLVGVGRGEKTFRKVPGPVVQISSMEVVRGADQKATIELGAVTVNGKPIEALEFSAIIHERLFEKLPQWAHFRSVVVPLPPGGGKFEITYTGKGKGKVTAMVNAAARPGERTRGAWGAADLP